MTPEQELELLRLRKRRAMATQGEPAAEAPTEARVPQVSIPEAIAAGAGQGALGIGDELGAGLQAMLAAASGARNADVVDTYRAARGENRQIRDAAWDQQPLAYAGGYAPGMVASMALPVGSAANAASKGVSLPALAWRLAKLGAPQGAIAAIGGSDAPDWGGNIRDIALGGIGGGIFGGASAPFVKLGGYLAPKLGQFAYRRAVKAAGPMLKDVRALQAGGRLEAVGQKLMEMGLIPPGAGVEGIANAVEGAAGARGADVHSILGELDALTPAAIEDTVIRARPALSSGEVAQGSLTDLPPALQSREFPNFPGGNEVIPPGGTVNQRVPAMIQAAVDELPGFNPARVGARARTELLEPLRSQPAQQDLIPALEQQIANLEALGNRRLAFTRANDIKRGYDTRLNWEKEQGPPQQLLKQLRGLINEEIEKGAEGAATAAGDPDLLSRFLSAKGDYRDLRQVADFARDRVARMQANNTFALPDILTGLGGGIAGAFVPGGHTLTSLLGGGAASYASKLARERGGSVAAHTALGLSNLLGNPGLPTALAGRGLTSIPGRRTETIRSLLELLAPSILGQTSPALSQSESLRGLGR